MKRSNLIPITRIYDIYPKYAYSEGAKKFMDEIVDIDRADVFTKADMLDILDKIRADIKAELNIDMQAHSNPKDNVYFCLDYALDVIDQKVKEYYQ